MSDLSKRLDDLLEREVPERGRTMEGRLQEARELLEQAEFNVEHWRTFQVMLGQLRSYWILPVASLGRGWRGTWAFVRRGTVQADSPDRFGNIRGLWVREFAVPPDAVGRYGIGIRSDQASPPPTESLSEVEYEPCRQCRTAVPLIARFAIKSRDCSPAIWQAEVCRLCLECVLLDYVGPGSLSCDSPFTADGKARPTRVESERFYQDNSPRRDLDGDMYIDSIDDDDDCDD